MNEIKSQVFPRIVLGADLVFFLLHISLVFHILESGLFDVRTDGGYPEIYQYLKEFLVVVFLLLVFFKTRTTAYLIWVLLFSYLLIDDSFQVHESAGLFIAAKLDIPPAMGLRPADFGEIMISLAVFGLLSVSLVIFYKKSTETFRRASVVFMVLLCTLAFFGVFVDMLHQAFGDGKFSDYILGSVEDGGEMIVMSMMLIYAYFLNLQSVKS